MLRIDGAVATARELSFDDLASLPGQIADVGTLAAGREGGAVALGSVLDAVGVGETASRATLESADGKFVQEAPLAALATAILIYRLGDRPLPSDKGGPIRFLIPNLEECDVPGVDRCTNVKALARIHIA
jgi:DMSO/TMAO reductase YedYZ molybdopterin-dependent catalytic subunit